MQPPRLGGKGAGQGEAELLPTGCLVLMELTQDLHRSEQEGRACIMTVFSVLTIVNV